MHFQLFFPNKSANPGACLREVGLADFVDGCGSKAVQLESGQPGLMVGWTNSVEYAPRRQQFVPACDRPGTPAALDLPNDPGLVSFDAPGRQEAPGLRSNEEKKDGSAGASPSQVSTAAYQIVLWTDQPFEAADVARQSLFPGRNVTLDSGLTWHVPEASALPTHVKYVDGKWKTSRKPQFAEFWNRSEVWYKQLVAQDPNDPEGMRFSTDLTDEQFLAAWADFCVFALRQNYRVTNQIISLLAPLDTEDLLKVTFNAVSGMNIKEVQSAINEAVERRETGLSKKEGASGIQGS